MSDKIVTLESVERKKLDELVKLQDIENIITKEIDLIISNKLNELKKLSLYDLLNLVDNHELCKNYTWQNIGLTSEDDIQGFLNFFDNYGKDLPINTFYRFSIGLSVALPIIQGKKHFVEGFVGGFGYEIQKTSSYTEVGIDIYVRSKRDYIWNDWKKLAFEN